VKQLVMLSGLPRSASQVLSSMLNQHPEILGTSTSPVADLVVQTVDSWPNLSGALVNPYPQQLANIVGGIIQGAYRHVEQPIVVDKNRWWPRFGSILYDALGDPPRIIKTVRPIEEILASFVLLIERNSGKTTYIDQDLIDLGLPINTKNRCRILWEKYIQHPYTSLRLGWNNPEINSFVVSYDQIVNQSQWVMDQFCQWMGIESIMVDLGNLQEMPENDHSHGGLVGLHDVRRQMRRTSPPPEEVLGRYLCDYYRQMNLEFWRK